LGCVQELHHVLVGYGKKLEGSDGCCVRLMPNPSPSQYQVFVTRCRLAGGLLVGTALTSSVV
jgi:hypothetical protein